MHSEYPYISKNEFLFNMMRLENILVSREDVETLSQRISTYSVTPQDIRKIDDMLNSLSYAQKQLSVPGLDTIKHINKLVVYGTVSDEKEGTIRKEGVKITNTEWKPPIPDEFQAEKIINNILGQDPDVPDITKAISLMIYLMKNQLFSDGNKRTAQFCANILVNADNLAISIPFTLQHEFTKMLILYYEEESKKEHLVQFLENNAVFRKDITWT